jgi:hypothetical protein
MRLLLMALGWWAVGFLISHLLNRKLIIDGGCPKCPKCWIASIGALLFGIGEYFFMPLLKMSYSSPEYLYSVVFAGLFGGAVYLVICPK